MPNQKNRSSPGSVARGGAVTTCHIRTPAAALAFVLGVAAGGPARAADPTPVTALPKSFPEGITSTSDGTLYFGSFNLGGVYKAVPGGKVETFVKPGANHSRTTIGVLADEKSGTLYVCSNDTSRFGVAGPSDEKGAALKTFDLKTGADKGSFPLKTEHSLCNDIVVGGDGTAYVTDSLAPYIYSLKPGGSGLDVWATDPRFQPKGGEVGLDGIALGSDGNLLVTTFVPGRLFKVAVKGGKAGEITLLKPSRKIDKPDGMRAWHDGFLLIEDALGASKLDKVTVKGDEAQIETIKEGFNEAVSVTVVGSTAWVCPGQLSYLLGDNKGKDPAPFDILPVPLPK